MLVHWVVTFWGNLAGSLFVAILIFGCEYLTTLVEFESYCGRPDGDVFGADPFKSAVITFASKKQVTPDFHMILLRGIGCNWLVCLACFFGAQGRSLASKIMGIWLPIFAFVSVGFDHVVANMTFIPLGIWLGTPGITVDLYIWKGIIPTLIGNILGGAIFCGEFTSSSHICMARLNE